LTGEIVRRDAATPVHTERDAHLSDRARQRMAGGVAPNTRQAYSRQWTKFTTWCESDDRVPLPATPETLTEYVTGLVESGFSASTIHQAMAAIRTMHRTAGYRGQPDTEAALLVLRDYRRTSKRRPRKATPITIERLREMVATCDASPLGRRDHTLLVFGWALYGRRSELHALELDEVTETERGLVVLVSASKTDQDAEGEEVAIPYGQRLETCPVRQVRAWRELLAEHEITTGRLFRSVTRHGSIGSSLSGVAVDSIVKVRARIAGLPHPESYSAHSLRAGGATASYKGGAPMSVITRHGRWAEGSPTPHGYIGVEDQWRDNPLAGTGM
jgi:site-specific recombinase XerD